MYKNIPAFSALKSKNNWRGIVNLCNQLPSDSQYKECIGTNVKRYTGILKGQYTDAGAIAFSPNLRSQALDKIQVFVSQAKADSDECLQDAIHKLDDFTSPSVTVGKWAFTNCLSRTDAYMRTSSETFIIDDFLVPKSLTSDSLLTGTEERVFNDESLA